MKRALATVCVTVIVFGISNSTNADGDKKSLDIIDKAVKALGGEEKLSKVKAVSWEAKGTIRFGDNENPFTSKTTVQDLDHFRREFMGEFNGNKFKGVTVINGDKGWRLFGDNNMELDKDGIANEKRNMYLQVIPATLLPLRGPGFKMQTIGEEKVGDTAALADKATGPDGKDFTLYFDKASGLPVKQVGRVVGFQGEEYTQETTLGNYKDFDGIKKATKVETLRDGQKFMDQEITASKILNNVDPKTFFQPE